MASRSSEAFQLQVQLSAETGVTVVVRLDQSTASRGPRWHVVWADGPTVDGMTAHVHRLLPAVSALDREALVYLRTIEPVSVALMMIRNVRFGLPPLGEHHTGSGLEQHLEDVPYPERAPDDDLALAAELCRLVPAGDTQSLATTIEQYGLAGLGARLALPDNVLPFRPRPER